MMFRHFRMHFLANLHVGHSNSKKKHMVVFPQNSILSISSITHPTRPHVWFMKQNTSYDVLIPKKSCGHLINQPGQLNHITAIPSRPPNGERVFAPQVFWLPFGLWGWATEKIAGAGRSTCVVNSIFSYWLMEILHCPSCIHCIFRMPLWGFPSVGGTPKKGVVSFMENPIVRNGWTWGYYEFRIQLVDPGCLAVGRNLGEVIRAHHFSRPWRPWRGIPRHGHPALDGWNMLRAYEQWEQKPSTGDRCHETHKNQLSTNFIKFLSCTVTSSEIVKVWAWRWKACVGSPWCTGGFFIIIKTSRNRAMTGANASVVSQSRNCQKCHGASPVDAEMLKLLRMVFRSSETEITGLLCLTSEIFPSPLLPLDAWQCQGSNWLIPINHGVSWWQWSFVDVILSGSKGKICRKLSHDSYMFLPSLQTKESSTKTVPSPNSRMFGPSQTRPAGNCKTLCSVVETVFKIAHETWTNSAETFWKWELWCKGVNKCTILDKQPHFPWTWRVCSKPHEGCCALARTYQRTAGDAPDDGEFSGLLLDRSSHKLTRSRKISHIGMGIGWYRSPF